MPTLYGDDGKGNVGETISVSSDQKFWFKGYADKVGDRIDVWFDEYKPYPPYDYVRSICICTLYSNAQRYFDSYPNDLCWIHDTGRKDGFGNKIWELYTSKRSGRLWAGPIETNIGFKATENNFPSKYVKVYSARGPADIYELRLFFIKGPWANEALATSILQSLASAVNPIIQPLGYRYIKTECNWTQSYYSVWFEKTGSPVIPLAAILAVIVGIGLLVSIFFYAVGFYHQGKAAEQQAINESDFQASLDKALAEGKITPEQYAQMLTAYRQATAQMGIPWNNILILAAVLGGAYILSKSVGSHARSSGGELLD